MKLIIDIPKDYYEIIKYDVDNHLTHYRPFEIIANGIPLPKEHGRLIDADILVDGMEDDYEFCEAVNATPTIIDAEKENSL